MAPRREFGSKAKKLWKSKIAAKAGPRADGTGEWRAYRRAKKVEAPPKAKKDRGNR